MQTGETHTAKSRKLMSASMRKRWRQGTYDHIHELMWSGEKGEARKAAMSKRMRALWKQVKAGKAPSPTTGKYMKAAPKGKGKGKGKGGKGKGGRY